MVMLSTWLYTAAALLPFAHSAQLPLRLGASHPDLQTCRSIAAAVSSPYLVSYPGSASYKKDTHHWAPSSSQHSACSVQPADADDVSVILQIIANSNTSFAVKSGGHTINPTFSSTPGVHIALHRLDDVVYDPKTMTVQVGAGLTWDQVYARLDPHGVNVIGGHNFGVGVSGFLLGGGYSWLSNRYGVAIDNVEGYELVLPSGEVVQVSSTSYPDLFFGLKGGFNNFGIVTKFILKAVPQGPVWGGLITYGPKSVDRALEATANFAAKNQDVDADIVAFVVSVDGALSVVLNVFYNAPTVKEGVFDEFLRIPSIAKDLKTSSFSDFVVDVSVPTLNPWGFRGQQSSVSLPDLTLPVLRQIANQTQFYTADNRLPGGMFLTWVEPFIPSRVTQSNTSATAWPHDVYFTSLIMIGLWPDESSDAAGIAAARGASSGVTQAAVREGQNVPSIVQYANHAIGDLPVENIYGSNLPRLRSLAKQYDPTGLMKRAGGFKF